jgi:type I restriction enzyme M protein
MTDAVPDDKVVDFIDGKLRRRTAEEYVRQTIERSLVKEYRYDRSNIAVEFSIKVGSARKRVDLAIFPDECRHTQQNVWALLECKKEGTGT